MNIQAKRVYDPIDEKDGARILVDRLWPRGMKKDRLEADEWLKDAAPSAELRKWYAHDPAKWEAFKRRYFDELDQKPEIIDRLRGLAFEGNADPALLREGCSIQSGACPEGLSAVEVELVFIQKRASSAARFSIRK